MVIGKRGDDRCACLGIPSLDPAGVLFRGLSLHSGVAQILTSTLLYLPLRVRVTELVILAKFIVCEGKDKEKSGAA